MNGSSPPRLATMAALAVLCLLAACGDPASSSTAASTTSASTTDPSSAAPSTPETSPPEPAPPAPSTAAPSGGGSGSVSRVSCTDGSCTVTLGGAGSSAQVMGISIAFTEIDDGRASLRADGEDLSLTAGQSATAGGAQLTCTEVTPDRVTLTVTRA